MKKLAVLLTLFVGLLLPVPGQPGELQISAERGPQSWTCHVPEKSAKVLFVKPDNLDSRAVLIYGVDRNYDGSLDALFIHETTADGKKQPFPHYYVYDTDYDGIPDTAFVDEHGNGLCTQMREVPVTDIVDVGGRKQTT